MVSPVTVPPAFLDTESLSSDVCKHGGTFKMEHWRPTEQAGKNWVPH